nr:MULTISPECIES: transposase [unclassified Bradyrhizobium]
MARGVLVNPTEGLDQKVDAIERELAQIYRESPVAKLLSSIPRIGPTTSTARAATVPDPTIFCSGREFAPPTPKQNSTGGKARPRAIPTSGTCSSSTVRGGWIEALLERGRPMVVAIAVSNKLARIVWRCDIN